MRVHPPVDRDGEPTGGFGDAHTLNVWSTADRDAPVLLWVHGGENTVGSSSQPEYAGDHLASLGIVFVSCNYRLAEDGYGALDGVRHNRGLLDVVSALRWIRRNITAYGGNPGNVTVAGQSSGAQTVAALMVMPAARGLFHKAVVHSLAGRFFTPAQARETQHRADPGVVHHQPVVDGDTLPRSPLEGPYGVELMVCHTADEDEYCNGTCVLCSGSYCVWWSMSLWRSWTGCVIGSVAGSSGRSRGFVPASMCSA
ncbi:carboxylesterase family protein [Lentzea sp. CC55]|uniref:carboxylesterase family protein n=1 Tax=Lentzea sp. CC55 TaxID=2884909 RepID=UPI001F2BDD25|nr:carboxylesterase family protein [Lentzea sp. CC55]MCG8924880.1 carboxylesterase family protein [Lentzea sp. CC55]